MIDNFQQTTSNFKKTHRHPTLRSWYFKANNFPLFIAIRVSKPKFFACRPKDMVISMFFFCNSSAGKANTLGFQALGRLDLVIGEFFAAKFGNVWPYSSKILQSYRTWGSVYIRPPVFAFHLRRCLWFETPILIRYDWKTRVGVSKNRDSWKWMVYSGNSY